MKKTNTDAFTRTGDYPIKNAAYCHGGADRVVLSKARDAGTDGDYDILGRPSGDYYKQADRLLRSEVEAERLADSDPKQAAKLRASAAGARRALRAFAVDR